MLGRIFLVGSIFNMSSQSLLVYKVSAEKSNDSCMEAFYLLDTPDVCRLTESDLQAAARKVRTLAMQSGRYQEKTKSWWLCLLCAKSDGNVAERACAPIWNCLLVLCGLGDLVNTEPCQFPEPGDLGARSSSSCNS